ncbi:MAG: BamA/TamA family outer membrane protein, partial [Elusimicrobia bacterium]|nr:BamA/TamA family outer membrane protein [Elusimicrobiota bacterium]
RLDLNYYNHFLSRQTLALHFQGEQIINPQADTQLLLGGDKGLRGYQLNQFNGNKLLLFNAENRFFLVDDVLRLASLGTSVFFDAGYVWDRGREVRFRDIKADIGAGFRIYLARSSVGNVLRFDIAYALNRIPGEDRVVITFGSEQAF